MSKTTTKRAPRRNARAMAVACAMAVVGCRLGGGPSGEAAALDEGTIDASVDSPAEGAPVSPPEAPVDAGDAKDVRGDATGSLEASDAQGADGAAQEAGGPCAPPAPVTGCDPVCNTGCAALSRCDLGATPNTGTCIGIWISTEGSACLKTATTDPCAVQLTCVNGTCKRLCYHDSDCTTAGATCCKESVATGGAASGFLACAACGP